MTPAPKSPAVESAQLQRSCKTFHQRFWARVDRRGMDECWTWLGKRRRHGYGVIRFRGRLVTASRAAWELFNGPIPDGMCIMHRCDNPPCVNPSHLVAGTQRDNNRDKVDKHRQATGEACGTSKLTRDQVATIRAKYATGGVTHRQLAASFGVSHQNICRILHMKVWAK